MSEIAPISQAEYEDTSDHILNTVGKPLDNIKIRIIDRETGTDCATGDDGEVLVQGFNLMTGYYKVPLESQSIDADGWMHTGDMGHMNDYGYLTIMGRYKEIIIRGGGNIMPAEVEAVISEMPEIECVKVVPVPSEFYGEEVAACIVFKKKAGSKWNEENARQFLKGRIAKYKIPSYFFLFDKFPILGSGKTDVEALKQKAAQLARHVDG